MISKLRSWIFIPLVALLLVAGSLLAPFNHDEDQYFAASQALFRGLPYRDFIYLQTPLNMLVGNWVMALWSGDSLFALRIMQALLGAGVIYVVLWENLKNGRRKPAILCALLMGSCYSFLFAATVFRNDMLPTLLSASGTALLAQEARRRDTVTGAPQAVWPVYFFSGLLLALAASAKVNFLILCAVPVIWIALQQRVALTRRLVWLTWLAAGGMIGALPSIFGLALDPGRFMWQVIEFGSEAPLHWYAITGSGERLTMDDRLLEAVEILVQGPALFALLLVGRRRFLALRQGESEGSRALLLDLFILAGLVAAFLPNPAWRQYYVVLLPALFMRLPGILEGLERTRRRIAAQMCLLFSVVGLVAWIGEASELAEEPERSIFVRSQESEWIGAVLRSARAEGSVASLSPHLAVDSGHPIDRRFTSGVFAYRWGVNRPDVEIVEMGGAGPDTVEALLAKCPPAAIVTGYEGAAQASKVVDLEAPLRAFAEREGYRLHYSPYGKARLYVRSRAAQLCLA